jgi:hypothetical protein
MNQFLQMLMMFPKQLRWEKIKPREKKSDNWHWKDWNAWWLLPHWSRKDFWAIDVNGIEWNKNCIFAHHGHYYAPNCITLKEKNELIFTHCNLTDTKGNDKQSYSRYGKNCLHISPAQGEQPYKWGALASLRAIRDLNK